MESHTCVDKVVFLAEENSRVSEAVISAAASAGYEVYASSEVADTIASWSGVVIVQEDLIDEWFWEMSEGMLTDSADEDGTVLPGIKTFLVIIGDGKTIPKGMSEFVHVVSKEDVSRLTEIIPKQLPCKACVFDDEIDLNIDFSSAGALELSFERIAMELFGSWRLLIGRQFFLLTEIEFYYYKKGVHEDTSVHEHLVDRGKWRCHSQGIDISLGYGDDFDGGILIRGIRCGSRAVNGPRRVLSQIFDGFGPVNRVQNYLGLVKTINKRQFEMFKTARRGVASSFREHLYRYYCDSELWQKKHYSTKDWQLLKEKSIRIS
jgi:hypothetical protein